MGFFQRFFWLFSQKSPWRSSCPERKEKSPSNQHSLSTFTEQGTQGQGHGHQKTQSLSWGILESGYWLQERERQTDSQKPTWHHQLGLGVARSWPDTQSQAALFSCWTRTFPTTSYPSMTLCDSDGSWHSEDHFQMMSEHWEKHKHRANIVTKITKLSFSGLVRALLLYQLQLKPGFLSPVT